MTYEVEKVYAIQNRRFKGIEMMYRVRWPYELRLKDVIVAFEMCLKK